ncbi:MAG: sodium/proline symporter [Bacteroidales bacterium]|nr:sodium/proline symporter [Bacteroidales bacterium]
MEANIQILTVMVVYVVGLLTLGFYFGRRVKSSSDFAIAGRKLPGWIAALSERSTGESSWALLGLPGVAYATGLFEIWTALGCFFGVVVSWWFLAWRLRNEAEKYEVNSFSEYLSKRHGDKNRWLRIASAFTIVFFFFFYVGAQFVGGSKIIENLFGIPKFYGMLIVLVMIVPYTIYGGFRSVTYTDVIQAIIMIITLVVTPIAGYFYLQNASETTVFSNSLWQGLSLSGQNYTSLFMAPQSEQTIALGVLFGQWFPVAPQLANGLVVGVLITGSFAWFFGFLGGQPQLSMRFMAIRSRKEAKQARNISIIWTFFAYSGALLIGWLGIAMFGPTGLDDQETVLLAVLGRVFPPAIQGILITGVLAAIISTANSLLILSSTELSENLVQPFLSKNRTPKNSLFHSRLITFLLAIVAMTVAWFSPVDLVFSIVSYVWSGIGSTFSVVILLTLFWKRFSAKAAILTIIGGLSFTVFWIAGGLETYLTTRILTFLVALMLALIGSIIVSRKN